MHVKNRQKIEKIKDICTKYFSNYDDHLQSMTTQVKNVMNTFEDWTRNVVKPA